MPSDQPPCSADRLDLVQAAVDLLPVGAAWPRRPLTDAAGNLAPELIRDRLLAGLTGELAEAWEQLCLVLRESNPILTVLLLERWETALGLPGPCTPTGATPDERRQAVLAKLLSDGGQDRFYFTRLIWQVFGLQVEIIEHSEFRAAPSASNPDDCPFIELYHARANGRCWDGQITFVWEVVIIEPPPGGALNFDQTWFRASLSVAGDRLRTWGQGITFLYCLLRTLKPAHTEVIIGLSAPAPGTLTIDQLWPIDNAHPIDLVTVAASR